jgi:predicted nucleic acid-binding protein
MVNILKSRVRVVNHSTYFQKSPEEHNLGVKDKDDIPFKAEDFADDPYTKILMFDPYYDDELNQPREIMS